MAKDNKDSINSEGYRGAISDILKSAKSIEKTAEAQARQHDALSKAQEAALKASALVSNRGDETSRKLFDMTKAVESKLTSSTLTETQIANRLVEIESLTNSIDKLTAITPTKADEVIEVKEDETIEAINKLIESQEKALEVNSIQNLSKELSAKISSLGGFLGVNSDETTKQLKETFSTINADLTKAIEDDNQEQIELSRKQLEAFSKTVQNQEEIRENRKREDERNSLLLRSAEGIKNLGTKFEGIAKGITSKAGFFAKLIPLALVILSQIDREKFISVMESLKDVFLRIVSVTRGIINILQGDTEEGVERLKANMLTVAGIIGGLAIFFAGPIVAVLGFISKTLVLLFKSIVFVSKLFVVFKAFFVKTLIPSVLAMFAGIKAALFPVLIIGAKFILIGALLAAAFLGIKKLLEMTVEKLKLDSVKDLLFIALGGLQDGLAGLVNFFIDIVNGVSGFISKYGNRVLKFFNIDFEIPTLDIAKLATDNASKAIAEGQQRRIERESAEADIPEITITDPAIVTDMNNTGFDLDNISFENLGLSQEMMKEMSAPSMISAPSVSAQDNSNTITNVIQQPSSKTSALIGSYSFAR